jgi:hypothetical protein
MANPEHTGSWAIQSLTDPGDGLSLVLRVNNTSITSTTQDESGAAGDGGVFTETFETENAHAFIAGDTMLSPAISTSTFLNEVISGSGTTLFIDDVTSAFSLADGVLVTCRRTSSLIPLGDGVGAASVTNFVRGDMCVVTNAVEDGSVVDPDRRMRVLGVQTQANQTATFTGTGTVATATVSSNHRLNVGDTALFTNSTAVSGEVTVVTVPSDTTFTFASTATSGSATLCGACLEVDEDLTWQGGTTDTAFRPDGRWEPIEAPGGTGDLVKQTYVRHWDYNGFTSQPVYRSVIVGESMYVATPDDEIMKYDGTELYRAGLPRWQPLLFTTQDVAASSTLNEPREVDYTAKDDLGKYFVLDSPELRAGDRVYESSSGLVYLIDRVDVHQVSDGGGTPVPVDEIRASVRANDDMSLVINSSGQLKLVLAFKYYARLNAVDSNSRVIASAAIGHQDMVVDYSTNGQIILRLVQPPLFGNYDVEKWEIELYRTTQNSDVFYFHSRQAATFAANKPYIEVYDGVLDDFIVGNDDLIHSALKGSELGTGWDQPPRAKHISSNKGRLILGNIKSYPELSITVTSEDDSAIIADSDLDGAVFTFRRDGTATGTTADMTNIANYEFTDTTAATTVVNEISFNGSSNINAGNDTIDTSVTYFVTGDAVVFSGANLPSAITAGTTYYVVKGTTTLIQIATSLANATADTPVVVDLAADGGASCVGVNHTRFMATVSGAAAGDWIYIYLDDSTDTDIRVAGWWQVNDVETSGEATVVYSGAANINHNQTYDVSTAATAGNVPVYIGATTADLNYTMRDGNPVSATASIELQAVRRLAQAINVSMRATDITITGQEDFTPWLLANAGNDYQLGQLVVSSPLTETTTPEVVVPTITTFSVFVEDLKRTSAEEISFVARAFPSRLVRSYPNYPEIFDQPFVVLEEHSDSVIDVNPEDGQEIQGVARFFGDSATGKGQQLSEEIVVFKTNSIYLVNTETRQVQHIDSRGLGCTAPNSIDATKNGIMFANESGMYMLTRSMEVVHIGLQVDRKWKRLVNLDQLEEATGHHWGTGRQYKLSVPVNSDSYNSEVFVLDYDTPPGQPERSAWTRYDNHPATGWANLGKDSFFSSTSGDVFKVRNRGEKQDFRDEASAVSQAEITLKAEDFGMPGSRKLIDKIMLMFDLDLTDITSVAVKQAKDLSTTFESLSSVSADIADQPYITVKVALAKKRTNYIQLKFEHSAKDEQMVLTGVVYQVRELNHSLMKEPQD